MLAINWIYCSDKLPEKEGEYITTCYDKVRDIYKNLLTGLIRN